MMARLFVLNLALTLTATAGTAAPAAPKPASKKKPLAGTVVRSKEYVVHRTPHEVEEFIGDVYYRQAERELKADWAQFDRYKGLWEARGHIAAKTRLKSGNLLEAEGGRAQHDTAQNRGWLSGGDAGSPVRYVYRVARSTAAAASGLPAPEFAERDRGTARTLEWDQAASEIHFHDDVHASGEDGEVWARDAWWRDAAQELRLHGDVRVLRPDGETWSEDTVYHPSNQQATLTGRRPILTHRDEKSDMAIQADVIALQNGREHMDADGKVQGWLWLRSLDKKTVKKG